MKVKERQGAKKGGYVGVFSGFIRTGGVLGLSKARTDGKSQRAMFRLKTKDGIEIPCGFAWDAENPGTTAALAVIGARPYDKILDAMRSGTEPEKVLAVIEKRALKAAFSIGVFVPEDAGWGAGLKPIDGEFIAKFSHIATRDKDSSLPVYTAIDEPRQSKRTKGSYQYRENEFRIKFVVLAGERRGMYIPNRMSYSIYLDTDGDYELDAESSRMGAEFREFLALHRVPASRLNPKKNFKDPDNGLPELEVMWQKAKVPLTITVEEGWVKGVTKVPEGVVIDGMQASSGGDDQEYASEHIATLFEIIEKKVKKDKSKSAWTDDGQLTVSGKIWFKDEVVPFLKENDIPIKFAVWTDDQVADVIEHLGFPKAAGKIRG